MDEGEKSVKKPYIKCPVCQKLMNRESFAYKSGVVINSCKDHGIWLDNGQLKSLFEWKKLGGEILHQEKELRNEKIKIVEQKRKIAKIAEAKGRDYEVEKRFYGRTNRDSDLFTSFLDFFD